MPVVKYIKSFNTRKTVIRYTGRWGVALVLTLLFGLLFSGLAETFQEPLENNIESAESDPRSTQSAGNLNIPSSVNLIDGSTLVPTLISGHKYYAQWDLQHEISISSLDELQKIGNDPVFPLDGHYYLTGDIDASLTANWNDGAGFIPVGTTENPFVGTFDGCGYTVTGLLVNQAQQDDFYYENAGLFGTVGASAEIRNLHIRNGSVTGWSLIGGLVGENDGGVVTDCSFSGRVILKDARYYTITGGLVGSNKGKVFGCHASAVIEGKNGSAGGLVGINYAQISDSFATGPVNASETSGGFCASNYGEITASFATGAVNNLLEDEGYCWWEENNFAGFCGWNGGEISFCHANGSVYSVTGVVGGLVGRNEGELFASYSTSAVRCGNNTIDYSHEVMCGGLCGENRGNVAVCFATGDVVFQNATDGLTDDWYYFAWLGGLIGRNYSDVTNCFASGLVTSGHSSTKGGLIGYNDGSVSFCYANGEMNFQQETPENLYAAWMHNRRGGLIGEGNSSLVTASYWDRIGNGRVLSAGGKSRITEEMTDSSAVMMTYEGWDFETVWQEDRGGQVNGGYPYLAAIPPKWTITFKIDATDDNPTVISEFSGTEISRPESPSRPGKRFLGWDQDIPATMPANNLTITARWEISPMEISSIEELQKISYDPAYPADIHYYLSQDIDASATANWNNGQGFLPISNNEHPFTGTFDGRGHVISGLVICQPEFSGNALFARTGKSGIVKSLGLVGGSISGVSAGGLVDKNIGLIQACYTSLSVSGDKHFAGGLVGHNTGTVLACYALGSTSGNSKVGGLVGSNLGTVSFSYAAGSVVGSEFTGGLIGVNEGVVSDSYWDKQSTGQETSAGGEGCSSEQMQWSFDREGVYHDWDFSCVWMEDAERLHNNGYPFLQACPPPSLACRALLFDSDGGTFMESIFRAPGSRIPPLSEPERAGSTYMGWYPPVPEFMPEQDLTLRAQWASNSYTLTFLPGEYGAFPEQRPEVTFAVTHGTAMPEPPEIHPETGYVFTGWTPEIPSTVTANMELLAQYQMDITDLDNDNLPDWWEILHFASLEYGMDDDPDGDHFSNWEEFVYGSDPNNYESRPDNLPILAWKDAVYKMRRIGVAFQQYVADHGRDVYPGRLQQLVDEGYLNQEMLLAIGDLSQGMNPHPSSEGQFREVYEQGISFFYELSEAPCQWSLPGFVPLSYPYSWYELKMFQLMSGGGWGGSYSPPYDRRAFPILRFFWTEDRKYMRSEWTSINLAIDLQTVFASDLEWERQSEQYLPNGPAVMRPFNYTFVTNPFRTFSLPLRFAVKDVSQNFNLRLVPSKGQECDTIYGEIRDNFYILTPDSETPSELTVTVEWEDENEQLCQASFRVELDPNNEIYDSYGYHLSEGRFTIYFDSAGGSDVPPISFHYGEHIDERFECAETHYTAPIKTGYTFAGWVPPLPERMPAEDLLVTATWVEESRPPEPPENDMDVVDTDNDNLPDWWEILHFASLEHGMDDDPDGDHFSNWEEFVAGADPNDPQSYPPDPALVIWHDAVYKLRRIGIALREYSANHGWDVFPGRLQYLVDEGYLNAFMLQAIGDESQGTDPHPHDDDRFQDIYEHGVSFVYELSEVPCQWTLSGFEPDSEIYSWYDLKMHQLQTGGYWGWGAEAQPYDRRVFPVVRFFWAIDSTTSSPGPYGTCINLAIDLKTVFISTNEWELSAGNNPDQPAVIRPFISTYENILRAQHTIPFRMPLWFASKDVDIDYNLRLVPTDGQGAIYGELIDIYYMLTPDLDTPEEFPVTVEWDDETGQVCQTTFTIKVDPIAFTINFDTDGGSELPAMTQNYGSLIIPPELPIKPYRTFMGWNPPIPDAMPAENMTCVAQWRINQYTVSFDSVGGNVIESITQNYDTSVAVPDAPSKVGYTFIGWEPAIPDNMPAEDITCVAQWRINQYTVSFDSRGGTEVADIILDYNSEVTAPPAPFREGYIFTGWNPPIPDLMPSEDITCVAQWISKQYTISFDANGGTSSVSEQSYIAGEMFAALPTARRPDYTFAGWCTSRDGGTQITVDTLVPLPSAGYTLYAHWELLPEYQCMTVLLQVGWNLISSKLNLTEASQALLREKNAVKLSQEGKSHVLCDKLTVPEACWVFAPTETEITLVGTVPDDFDFEASLKTGWNFVGPLNEHRLSNTAAVVWGWNGQHFYLTEILKAGEGYYVYKPEGL